MVSIKVRVENKDNRLGGRNTGISVGSHSFKTPHRTATNKDYHAASSLPHKVTIENPISEYISDFNNQSLQAFLTSNGSFRRRRSNSLNQSIDMMRYSPIMSTIQFPKDNRVHKDDLMLFDLFQNNPQFSIISIPPFKYGGITEFEQAIGKYSEKALSRGQEAMPVLSMSGDLDIFKREFEVLKNLRDSDLCKVIGFSYANPFSYPQQMMEIYRHRDEGIWYHCFGIPRTPRGRGATPVAHIHELQNWGLDTFSPRVTNLGTKQIRYLIMKSQSTKPEDLECRRFDSPTLGILKEPDWRTRYGHDLHCKCLICKGKDLQSFKEEYSHELNGNFNPNLLRYADKVHELGSGSEEFGISKEAIKSDDLPTYFQSKEFTKDRIMPPSSPVKVSKTFLDF